MPVERVRRVLYPLGRWVSRTSPSDYRRVYSRRPSPILYLELQLAEPSQAKFSEKMIELHDVNQQGRGTGNFKQHVAVEWNAILRNSGRGSANHVVLDLRVPESSTCSIVSSDFEVKEYFDSSTNIVPVLMPLPTADLWTEPPAEFTSPFTLDRKFESPSVNCGSHLKHLKPRSLTLRFPALLTRPTLPIFR